MIYWGGPDGFSVAHRTSLPTWGGYGICVADYNRDGCLDLAIPSYKGYKTRKTDSKVFWGSAEGYRSNNTLTFRRGRRGVHGRGLQPGWVG